MANMPEVYDVLYNRILDVSACIHIPLKLFAVFVIIRYTPHKLRRHSYFILNVMFWNFLTNLVCAFVHIYPLLPAQCFRLDGPLSLFLHSEGFGHAIFFGVYAPLCNVGVAFGMAFLYRYISFAFPHFAARIRPFWVFLLCCVLHLAATLVMVPVDVLWIVSYDDCPNKAELPERTFAFCFHPDGFRKMLSISAYLTSVTGYMAVITLLSILFIMKVRNDTHAFHPQTIALQRKLFMSLLISTSIALLFGGIPLLIIALAAWFPYLPYSRLIVMVSILFICNHGSIYAITYLVLFKTYRDAVKQMLAKLIVIMRLRPAKNITPPSVVVTVVTL